MRLRFGSLLAAVAVLGAVVVASASPVSAQPDPALAAQVAERDTLIAAQENLLNAYRCMFQVDLGAVKGGQCPADEITPGAAPSEPTAADVEARDNLVAAQENLLNAYRCNHQIDTELVPGGCGGQTPAPDPQPDPGTGQTPAAEYTAVETGGRHACAVKTDQSVVCWGINWSGQTDAPAGQYTAVSANDGFATGYSCAIRTDQSIACWGWNGDGQTDAPAGQYTAVSAGTYHACALRTDQTIACWGGNDYYGQTDAPAGQYTAVSAGWDYSCALRVDQTIACWGYNAQRLAPPQSGRYTAVAAGLDHACALRTDQAVVCWGNNRYSKADAPAGQYTAVSVGAQAYSCAIRDDQSIACWGSTEVYVNDVVSVSLEPPAGRYTAVTSGPATSCAIRDDGAVVCWGDAEIILPEDG